MAWPIYAAAVTFDGSQEQEEDEEGHEGHEAPELAEETRRDLHGSERGLGPNQSPRLAGQQYHELTTLLLVCVV